MMLREGWDVQNVVTIVGLRPYTAESKILPEQTLGRGLRRMFRGEPVPERVSVIGTDAFIAFVEGIKAEGVELEYEAMGAGTRPKCPIVVEVDTENEDKDIGRLDIELPVLAPRIYREYKNLNDLDVAGIVAQETAGQAVHRGRAAGNRLSQHRHRARKPQDGNGFGVRAELPERHRLLHAHHHARSPAGRRLRRAVRQGQAVRRRTTCSTGRWT